MYAEVGSYRPLPLYFIFHKQPVVGKHKFYL